MTEQRRDLEIDEGEASSVDQVEKGSAGATAETGSLAGQVGSGWQGQAEGQDGGALGQEGVAGGESWEGQARDIGMDANTTGDSGATEASETRMEERTEDQVERS